MLTIIEDSEFDLNTFTNKVIGSPLLPLLNPLPLLQPPQQPPPPLPPLPLLLSSSSMSTAPALLPPIH